jgi:hypothetical protein
MARCGVSVRQGEVSPCNADSNALLGCKARVCVQQDHISQSFMPNWHLCKLVMVTYLGYRDNQMQVLQRCVSHTSQ